MVASFLKFDWDKGNREKCLKHGVSIEEIEMLLSGAPYIAPDVKHSSLEDRYIAIGRNNKGRPLFVGFTFRDRGETMVIRPVTARYMHQKEIRSYEKEKR